MTLVLSLAARVEERVEALAKRVQGAAELAALLAANQIPQVTPAGFALPGALRPGNADAAAGIFRQGVTETVLFVLVTRNAGDATGARSLPEISQLINQIVAAVCGWGPAEAIGVFQLAGGRLAGVRAGAVFYELHFSIDDQLRIAP